LKEFLKKIDYMPENIKELEKELIIAYPYNNKVQESIEIRHF